MKNIYIRINLELLILILVFLLFANSYRCHNICMQLVHRIYNQTIQIMVVHENKKKVFK